MANHNAIMDPVSFCLSVQPSSAVFIFVFITTVSKKSSSFLCLLPNHTPGRKEEERTMPVSGKFPPNAPTVSWLYLLSKTTSLLSGAAREAGHTATIDKIRILLIRKRKTDIG